MMMKAVGAAALFSLLTLGAIPAQAQAPDRSIPERPPTNTIERDIAVLRWLDKVTARVQTLNVPVNESVRIQTLELIVRTCTERPPEEPPESAVFIDVWERRPGQPVTEVYRGWMFASSPALSAMEHPVYDLWVLDCMDSSELSTSETETSQ